ncbi:hypothetical protein [Sorlinia euscelidii]
MRCFEAFQQFPTDLLEVARNLNVRGYFMVAESVSALRHTLNASEPGA